MFVYRARWFALDQTDGLPYQPVAVNGWSEPAALAALGVSRVPFEDPDGNVQGYSQGRSLAINPVAGLPHKTLLHELAHIVLGHTRQQPRVARHREEPRRGLAH